MRTILVVDDEESIAEALVTLLEDEGYRVLSCSNGKEGLECAARERVDLYLLDIMMPVMDGQTMAEQLLEQGIPPEKIVYMTAVPQSVNKDRFPAIPIIKKPFQIDNLLDTIEKKLG